MKPTLVKAWVKALRSGKFKQTNGVLREVVGDNVAYAYCCLGVLAEVCKTKTALDRDDLEYALRDASCLVDDFPEIGLTNYQEEKLIAFNDDKEWSFRRIATWIEKTMLPKKTKK